VSGRLSIRAAALAVAVAAVVSLAGCTSLPDSPTVDVPSSAAAAPVPTTTGSAPTASRARALQELTRFDAVNRRTVRRARTPGGRAFIDALADDGFERADMQVTEDRTTIGLPAPSVQFSVLWNGSCLIGQYGAGAVGYRSEVADPVDGRCLIGRTRPIDW
jgi:hypothetical protein